MQYFVREATRKASQSSDYYEFQNGIYHGNCWLNDSICMHADLWDTFRLSDLFRQAIPKFDDYGVTTVNRSQWVELCRLAKGSAGPWEKVIAELTPWVTKCFENNDVFSILGI